MVPAAKSVVKVCAVKHNLMKLRRQYQPDLEAESTTYKKSLILLKVSLELNDPSM